MIHRMILLFKTTCDSRLPILLDFSDRFVDYMGVKIHDPTDRTWFSLLLSRTSGLLSRYTSWSSNQNPNTPVSSKSSFLCPFFTSELFTSPPESSPSAQSQSSLLVPWILTPAAPSSWLHTPAAPSSWLHTPAALRRRLAPSPRLRGRLRAVPLPIRAAAVCRSPVSSAGSAFDRGARPTMARWVPLPDQHSSHT